VASHFTGHNINPQRQNFLKDIYSISFEVCATELMALLLECNEIKQLWPIYNRALKRFEPKYGLYQYEARSGYNYLAIGKLAKNQSCIEVFNSEYEGITLLRSLIEKFEIDYRFCKYGSPGEGEAPIQTDLSNLPDVDHHNAQIENAIAFYLKNRPSFAIMDKGRTTEERSCIWVENGHFYGMGYIGSDLAFNEVAELKDFVKPYRSNHYIMQLIYGYAEKFPGKVKIEEKIEERSKKKEKKS
jgi:DNA polymerase-3 subunit epsilon